MVHKDFLIYEIETVKEALKKLDKTAEKVLLVVNKKDNLIGTITDGDIRRFVLKGGNIENDIRAVYNRKPTFLRKGDYSIDGVKDMFIAEKLELIPIVDENNIVVDFITWNHAFSAGEKPAARSGKIDVPVVIMAGGKSTRLEPFTKIFPKPLIPIGDKPVIEIIIDEFRRQGADKFVLVLNYKGEMVESYFNSIEKDYEVKFAREDSYRGTAGGLKLLEKEIGDTFIVSNCDVLVKANFEEVLNLHKEEGACLTVLSSIQHYKIPYGVIKFEEGGRVLDIAEKPEYSFVVNAGVYILEKSCFKYIPDGTHFDMTDLIRSLIENNNKVLTYPVNENDYVDIGQWEEYKKAVEKLQFLR